MTFPTDTQIDLWVGLNRIHMLFHQSIEAALKANGLPPLRWYDVLWEIERSEEELRPLELEQRLLFEQYNLSRQLQRMENEGLITLTKSQKDKRSKIVTVTQLGRTTRAKMWKIYGPLIRKNMEDLNENNSNVIDLIKSA